MRTLEFEEAVCVQANNRLFAVIFWFVLLGPIGAWAFRVSDLIRRRAVFSTSRRGFSPDATMAGMQNDVSGAATDVHGWLAWIPARLVAIGYGLAGSFDAAKHAWKTPEESRHLPQSVISEELLARVGTAALALQQSEDETDEERALFEALDAAEAQIAPAMEAEDFGAAMSAMAGLRAPIGHAQGDLGDL